MRQFLKRSWHWIVLLVLTDGVFAFVTWIIRREAMKYISLFLLLFTVFAMAAGIAAELHHRRKEESALLSFLEHPDDKTIEALFDRFGSSEAVRTLCTRYLAEQALVNEKTVELTEYQEYIEAWVHEVKTPLSLSTLMCDNHRDEMSPYVYARLNYIRHQLNEDVERILYYARLQTNHSDIRFMRFSLDECAEEVLSEYRTFIDEKKIVLTVELPPLEVVSDRRIVMFILSQLFSNAVKYADINDGRISVAMAREEDEVHLSIINNGEGVPPEDLPFIFDKGFTGGYPGRQKATGMGLYLVRKYSRLLCVGVRPISPVPFESGFGIELVFNL